MKFAQNTKSIAAFSFMLSLFLGAAPHLRADVVVLQGGETMMGIVTETSPNSEAVSVTTSEASEVKIARSRIVSIKKEPASTSWRRIAEGFTQTQRWKEAKQALEKAIAAGAPQDPKIPDLQNVVRRELEAKDQAQIQNKTATDKASLEEAENALAQKEFQKARDLIAQTVEKTADPAILQRASAILPDLEFKWGMYCEDKYEKTSAARHYQEVLRYNPNHKEAAERLSKLWSKDPSKRDEAEKMVQQRLTSNPNDLAAVQELSDIYLANQKYDAALPLLQRLYEAGQGKSQDFGFSLGLAYEKSFEIWAGKKEYGKAAEEYAKYLKAFPEANPQPLAWYQYMNDYAKLNPKDYTARAALAQTLVKKGYALQARQEIALILSQDPTNQEALKAQHEFALEDLRQAQANFNAQQYALASAGLDQILVQYASLPDIVKSAQDLKPQAELQFKKQQRTEKEKVAYFFELGNLYYNKAYYYAGQMSSTRMGDQLKGYVTVKQSGGVIQNQTEVIENIRRGIEAYHSALYYGGELNRKSNANVVDVNDIQNRINDLTRLSQGMSTRSRY